MEANLFFCGFTCELCMFMLVYEVEVCPNGNYTVIGIITERGTRLSVYCVLYSVLCNIMITILYRFFASSFSLSFSLSFSFLCLSCRQVVEAQRVTRDTVMVGTR